MNYYNQLPDIEYEFEGKLYIIKNVFLKVGFLNLNKEENNDFFDIYVIQNGERPETIAYKYYGNQSLWWLVILVNDIKDPFFDWYLSIDELEEWAELESIRLSPTGISDDVEKELILSDLKTENEKKREIYLLKPEYVNSVLINLIKNNKGIS